jgi:probable HAF family extracellular repeat protein
MNSVEHHHINKYLNKNRGRNTMNHCYRLIYNRCHQVWQAVAENATSQSKGRGGAKKLLLAGVLAAALPLAHAEDGELIALPNAPLNNTIFVNAAGNSVFGTMYMNGKREFFQWNTTSGLSNLTLDPSVLSVNNTTLVGISAVGDVLLFQQYGNAFLWSEASGLQKLVNLTDDDYLDAKAINANGSVVVGVIEDDLGANQSFRWTKTSNEATTLAVPSGYQGSSANGVNAAGDVVIGTLHTDNYYEQAYRWTEASGEMEALGTLSGGDYSSPTAVNTAGDVVVGLSRTSDGSMRAFRWDAASKKMADLGVLDGTTESAAIFVNVRGDVVAGASVGNNITKIFRWTAATNQMTDIGALNEASFTRAYAMNAAGDVIVGTSGSTTIEQDRQAFRWSASKGMQSVEQWLEDNGVSLQALIVPPPTVIVDGEIGPPILPGLPETTKTTTAALGVNAEGNVIVGTMNSGTRTFIARVSSQGSGLIDVEEFNTGLGRVGASAMMAENNTDLVMNGMHSNPMQMLLKTGESAFWLGGDFGRQDREARKSDMVVGEIGFGRRFSDTLQLNLAAGHNFSKSDTDHGGRTRVHSNFILPELVITLPGSLYATVSAFYSNGKLKVDRGYLNAGVADTSKGDPSVETLGARLRLDWHQMANIGGWALTPYTSITYTQTKIDADTEQGGGFPVRWDERKEDSTTARLGLDLVKPVSDAIKLQARLEGVHRFEKKQRERFRGNPGLERF